MFNLKFFKYEIRTLIKAIEFYIDVFRNEKTAKSDLEILKEIKSNLEKGVMQ